MSDNSKIEWTEATWNPVRGCTRVSPGCGGPGKQGGCYAEGIAARFSGPGQPYEGFAEMRNGEPHWTGKLALIESALTVPLRWKKPRRVFVNSMSDLFHEKLKDEDIDRVFAVMALCPQHTFQVLTKRPERMREYVSQFDQRGRYVCSGIRDQVWPDPRDGNRLLLLQEEQSWPLPNVWLGVSCERQEEADERIPLLLQTPAAVRFVSAEPLLGPIDLTHITLGDRWFDAFASPDHCLDWVIVGGESGPKARPMHPQWARDLRDQCVAAGVPFFFKQWGEWASGMTVRSGEEGRFALWHEGGAAWLYCDESPRHFTRFGADARMTRVGKKAAGRLLDGREWNEMPRKRKAA